MENSNVLVIQIEASKSLFCGPNCNATVNCLIYAAIFGTKTNE